MSKPLYFEGIIDAVEAASLWGGKPNDAMASFCDATDGPETRVRFLGTFAALQALAPEEGAKRWLVPDDDGEFSVSEHNPGEGLMDCVVMRGTRPVLTDGVHAINVEKWVHRDKIKDQYPIGKRFSLVSERP